MNKYTEMKRHASRLFNKGGLVLDFSSAEFGKFTMDSVGIDVMDKYQLSKGKSLEAFMDESSRDKVLTLISDLMEYYKVDYPDRLKVISDEKFYHSISEYLKNSTIQLPFVDELDENKMLDSNYIKNIIDSMLKSADKFPAQTIGNAKDLLESVMKMILENLNVSYKDLNMPKLTNTVFRELKLSSKTKKKNLRNGISDYSDSILGNLKTITVNMYLLRNEFGTGHGRGPKQEGTIQIPPRYARLMIGSVSTVVLFLIETYEYLKTKDHNM